MVSNFRIQQGNLNENDTKLPETKGWFIGDFLKKDNLFYSDNLKVKWHLHPKGTKKTSGLEDDDKTTLLILISGKWKKTFPNQNAEFIMENPGDYLVYKNGLHEDEAIDESQVVVIKW